MAQERKAGSFIIGKDGKKKENLKDAATKARFDREKAEAEKKVAEMPVDTKK